MQKQSFIPPVTSLLAHNGVKERKTKITHAEIILASLKRFKAGNYVQIAGYCGLKELQVVRRLSEMEERGLIKRTGRYAPTSSTDVGEIWAIVETPETAQEMQGKLFEQAA